MAWNLEKHGAIVLGLHLLPDSYFEGKEKVVDHLAEHEGVADEFNELHLRKIDISDSVLVLNVDGYFGEDTKREIAYAEKLGKPISYLEGK